MSSRISKLEENWFIKRGASAPWHLLRSNVELAAISPTSLSGHYVNALALYDHFAKDPAKPTRVDIGKLHKVLYLMRPSFFPILDSRLQRLYMRPASATARRL